MTRTDRVIAAAVFLLLVVGAAAVLLKPVRDMREDIDVQRTLLLQQLAVTQQQLDLLKQQLEVTQETRDVVVRSEQRTAQLVAVSRSLLAVTRGLARDAGVTADDQARGAARTPELARLARETERPGASIHRKTVAPSG